MRSDSSGQKWEIADIFLCLHSQIRATHWISFSVRSLSLSLSASGVWLFRFCLTVFSPESLFMGSLLCDILSLPVWGWKIAKWMLVSNNMLSRNFFFWRIPKKRCKNVVNVWWKCHLQDCTCLTVLFTKGIHCIEERREICCIVYKVMFIQYFNITSDFRGRYLNRILYLHVKCQQQFIDIVLPFIIRVLIVFLIFV